MLLSILNSCAIGAVVIASMVAPLEAAPRTKQQGSGDEPHATAIGRPVMAIVALKKQRISVYDAEGKALRAKISSGQTGYETPVGVYSVLQKNEEHYSNLYDDAEMPFMQRLTWSGIALHGGALPGYPASHGCVRLPEDFAEKIFHLSKLGMRVVVVRDEVAPVAISHPLLLQPNPIETEVSVEGAQAMPTGYAADAAGNPEGSPFSPDLSKWPARQRQLANLIAIAEEKAQAAAAPTELVASLKLEVERLTSERHKMETAQRAAEKAKNKAQAKLERVQKAVERAKSIALIERAEQAKAKAEAAVKDADDMLAALAAQTETADREIAHLMDKLTAAEAMKASAVAAAEDARRKTLPVSIFISLKTQRLYVRQGHQPVLDTAVTIRDPDRPVGTHVFTAVDYADGANELRWTAVSIVSRTGEAEGRSRKKASHPPASDAAAARAALDRVTLPPEIVSSFSEFVWPGSSLIVSDEPPSSETGTATDFVVLISSEPQGGIKKRPKKPAPVYRTYPDREYDIYDYERPRRRPRGGYFYWW